MYTPWGKSDARTTYAPGIEFYSTPSHGGFKLSTDRVEQIPSVLRGLSGYPDNWYEEDCAYAVVPYIFPEAFVGVWGDTTEEVKQYARGVLQRWYPEELQRAETEHLFS